MNTCAGCKHLFEYGGRGFCGEAVLPAEYVVDPTSGIGGYHERLKYGLSLRSNSTELMTQPGMPCGPERVLYEHKWFIRMLKKLMPSNAARYGTVMQLEKQMNELQKKALKQAAAELSLAENIVLMRADKDFGSACRRETPASEVMELVRSAQEWITLVQVV